MSDFLSCLGPCMSVWKALASRNLPRMNIFDVYPAQYTQLLGEKAATIQTQFSSVNIPKIEVIACLELNLLVCCCSIPEPLPTTSAAAACSHELSASPDPVLLGFSAAATTASPKLRISLYQPLLRIQRLRAPLGASSSQSAVPERNTETDRQTASGSDTIRCEGSLFRSSTVRAAL